MSAQEDFDGLKSFYQRMIDKEELSPEDAEEGLNVAMKKLGHKMVVTWADEEEAPKEKPKVVTGLFGSSGGNTGGQKKAAGQYAD